jgi:hypothetical protein
MVLIESNLAMHGVQDWIFFLSVLFGLVMTQPSRANDGVAESVLATETCCHHRVMLVTMLLSHASDGAAELVLSTARQGATADRQGDVAGRQGATAAC